MKNNSVTFFVDKDSLVLSPSDEILRNFFGKMGVNVEVRDWEQDHKDLSRTCNGIIRATRNYQNLPDKFLEWVSSFTGSRKILNGVDCIIKNSNKKYLLELQQKDVAAIPTWYVPKNTHFDTSVIFEKSGERVFVVKPVIGNSGEGVERYSGDTYFSLVDTVIQPFVQEFEEGEISVVFVNGVCTHAIKRTPRKGDFRANVALGATVAEYMLSESLIDAVENVLNTLSHIPFYGRVDFVSKNGAFLVTELEFIEPGLFFGFNEAAAERFVHEYCELYL